MTVKIKQRKCKNKGCNNMFIPFNSIQRWCSPSCGYEIYAEMQAKKERKKSALRKEALKTRQEWLKDAQTVFNRFIRLRDGNICISCGTSANVQYAAGHYLSVGSNPALRFNEDNVHSQCNNYCNKNKSGNSVRFRQALVLKIGIERLEALEGPHEPLKLSIDEIKELIAKYKLKIKEMING